MVKGGGLGLVFKKGVHRGVPTPVYDVELQIAQGDTFVNHRNWVGITNTEVDPGKLAAGDYRWRVTAITGDIKARSAWGKFKAR